MDCGVRRYAPRARWVLIDRITLDPASAAGFALLGLFAALVARKRPACGLALLVVCDPFAVARYVGWTTITIPKIALAGVACGLLLRRTPLAPLRRSEPRALLCAALAIAFVTALTAIPGTYVDAVARESLKAFEYLATFAIALVAMADDPDETPLWRALAAVVAIVCVSALIGERTGAPSSVMLMGRVLPRVAGLLDGPNQLAGFFDLALVLAFARAVARRTIGWIALVGLAALTDLLTLSRAGTFAAILGAACVAGRLARPALRRAIAIVAAATFAVAAIVLARTGLLARFVSTSDVDTASGLGSRGELWSAALTFWRAHPILGIGAGNFELELPTLGLIGVRTHANSLYLQSLAEGGLLLFCATAFAVVAAVRTFFLRAPRTALFVGVGAGSIALGAHQLVDDLVFFPKVGGFWWLWLGIAAGALVAQRRSAQT